MHIVQGMLCFLDNEETWGSIISEWYCFHNHCSRYMCRKWHELGIFTVSREKKIEKWQLSVNLPGDTHLLNWKLQTVISSLVLLYIHCIFFLLQDCRKTFPLVTCTYCRLEFHLLRSVNVNQSIMQSIHQQSANQSINQVNQSIINQLINRSISQLINQSIN